MRRVLARLGGEGFGSGQLRLVTALKHFWIQKILGINRNVPWPVHWSSKVKSPGNIQRGSRFPGLSIGCYIDGRNGILIDENVWIGPRVSIISMNHDPNSYQKYQQAEAIRIKRNCWIGSNAVILPSVVLQEHTVVAAGAVVTRSFHEPNILIAGVPARKVKDLEPYSD